MQRIDEIIRLARQHTGATDYPQDASGVPTGGISDDLLVGFANDAQDHLQAVILKTHPFTFLTSETQSVVSGTEAYELTGRLFVNNRIVQVEYSYDGQTKNFDRLPQKTLLERDTSETQHPDFWIRYGNQILLNPLPSSNVNSTIRVTYYRELDDLDIRRGAVASSTIASLSLSALSASTTGDDAGLTRIVGGDYVCIVNKDGTTLAQNIGVSAYSSVSGVFTLDPNPQTLATGSTAPAGAFICMGKYRTTHSQLPDNCERYLKLAIQLRIMNRNSSSDAIFEMDMLKDAERDIIESMSSATAEDPLGIPIIDPSFMY